MAAATKAVQIASISTSLLAGGGILTMSIFDVPQLQSLSADRSLPSIRWLFSRGSHIFPQAAFASAAGFVYSAYTSLPAETRTLSRILRTTNGFKFNTFLLAAALAISIGPFTSLMIPNNFALIKENEKLGGARSKQAAEELEKSGLRAGQRSADDSVESKGEGSQFTDVSNPEGKTPYSSSKEQDEKVMEMLGKFGRQNLVRGALMTAGGILGLVAALS